MNTDNHKLGIFILDVLIDWGNIGGEFDGYWLGYDSLKEALQEKGIECDIKRLKKEMKTLSEQNKVELRYTYNSDYKIAGRGWFIKN